MFILERYLHGPEVFAETIVSRGKVLRCTFRALKLPVNSGANLHKGRQVAACPCGRFSHSL